MIMKGSVNILKMIFAAFCVMMCTSYANAQHYYVVSPFVEENGISYDVSGGNARLWNSVDDAMATTVVIPSQVKKNNNSYDVTELRPSSFCKCNNVERIV